MSDGTNRKASGIIDAITKDGKRFKMDDGNWYGCLNKSALGSASRGDMVEFTFKSVEKPSPTGGTTVYNNVQGSVHVVGRSTLTPTRPSSIHDYPTTAAAREFPISRELMIVRQTCIKAACEYTTSLEGALKPEHVVEVARVFEAYCTGKENATPDPSADLIH